MSHHAAVIEDLHLPRRQVAFDFDAERLWRAGRSIPSSRQVGTRLVTNAQDTTYFEQQTLPFGTALNESPPAGGTTGFTNRRFTTYDRSLNTGLDYALNRLLEANESHRQWLGWHTSCPTNSLVNVSERHYDPQQGRFTQVDPIGMQSTSVARPPRNKPKLHQLN